MYNSQEIAYRIKLQAKKKGVPVSTLLSSCELGVNTVSKLSKGTDILSKNLAKISDFLDCSVDYLLGRTDEIGFTDSIGYDQLDDIDKAEVRGMIRQMLKADKYKEEQPQYIETKVAARGGGVMTHTMTKEELAKADAETTEFEGFDEPQKF